MRSEIAAADRRFEVRRAATTWRKAGEIDGAAEAAIAGLYPDDRVRTSRIFRVLFFIFTWFGLSTAYGCGLALLAASGLSWENTGTFTLLHMAAGVAMLAVAEWLTAGMRLRRFGIEEASVWIGSSYLVGGGLWYLAEELDFGLSSLIVIGAWATAGLATLAVWRWATPGLGAVASLAIFAGLSQTPWNHLLWLLVAGLAVWPLATLSLASHLSPEHRRRFGEAFVVFAFLLYFAIHISVVELHAFQVMHGLEGSLFFGSGGTAPPAGPLAVALSLVAMILVPLALILVGLTRRYRAAIALGLLLAGVTGVTFAQRWDLGPLWLRLILEGAGLGALALYVRRELARRPGEECNGLTALALAEDRSSAQSLEVLATLAAFTPAARQVQAGGFEGGGGEFGGGGASARF